MRRCLAISGLLCSFAAAQAPLAVPVDVQIPVSPAPFASQGKLHYLYEIHLANFDRRGRAVTLSSVEVLGDRGKQLAKLSAEDLTKSLMQPGLEAAADVRRLAAGRLAVLFLWVSMAEGDPRPTNLQHRFVFTVDGVTGENTLECCRTQVSRGDPLVIGPPLRGGGWLAGNGPSNASDHRRALLTLDGHAYLAQRFAIDWIRFGTNGELAVGKGAENREFASYGVEVIAVANARVTGLKDGIIENKPRSRAVEITADTIAGNFVTLDLGNGRYAHYAHLQPGSLRVKVGDRVKPGQVLALLGNSGNSDAPHLHFQITDGPSFLESEGLPYSLPSFIEEGEGPDLKFKPASAPAEWRNQLPVDSMVVRFPQ